MIRKRLGRCAGALGTLAVLLFWVGVALPSRMAPRVGGGLVLGLLASGVVLTAIAMRLDSKWWLLMVGGAVATLVLFYIASGA
jgi:hypothetical protein